MCGRFNLRSSVSDIVSVFLPGFGASDFSYLESSHQARYNIAPTQPILCVVQPDQPLVGIHGRSSIDGGNEGSQERTLAAFRWGLVPSWAKDIAIGNRMINARSETAAEKPSFKSALKSRRCVIPADGYYEWQKTETGKQPYEFFAIDGKPLALAGLWERNSKVLPNGETLYTCTILTTSSNGFTSDIHDRMPVILSGDSLDEWLDPKFSDMQAVESMLVPAAEDLLGKRPVSRMLNNVRNQGAELLQADAE